MMILAGLVSCESLIYDYPSDSEKCTPGQIRMTANALASGYDGATRAEASEDEKAFSDGMIWVFSGTGDDAELVSSAPITPASPSATFTLTGGTTYRFAAWLNDVPTAAISTWADMKALSISLAGEALKDFTMTGYTDQEASDGMSVTIPCFRQVARVRLSTVKTNFADTSAHYNKPFYFMRAFLINVQGSDSPFVTDQTAMAGLTPSWYNIRQILNSTPAGMKPLLQYTEDAPSAPLKTLTSNGTMEFDVPFYCMFNYTENDQHNAAAEIPEKTRLVIECRLDSLTAEPCYYPATIATVERNNDYVISFTIEGSGNRKPDEEWLGWTDMTGGAHSGDWEPGGFDPVG